MFVRLIAPPPKRPPVRDTAEWPYGGLRRASQWVVSASLPSRKNAHACAGGDCFEKAPMGGLRWEVGILFADVRGFTALAERQTKPDAVATLLNRFYATAVNILCEHAIIDKLVGDQVMALYLPQIFPGEPARHMIADAQSLLAAAGYGEERPWVRARHRSRLRDRLRGQRRLGRGQGLHGDRRCRQHRQHASRRPRRAGRPSCPAACTTAPASHAVGAEPRELALKRARASLRSRWFVVSISRRLVPTNRCARRVAAGDARSCDRARAEEDTYSHWLRRRRAPSAAETTAR